MPTHYAGERAFIPIIIGAIRHEQGAYDEAYERLRQALTLCQQLGIPRNTAFALGLLARTVRPLGHRDDIQMLMQEHLHLVTETEDRSAQAFMLEHLALAIQTNADPNVARQYFRQAIAHYTDLGDRWRVTRSFIHAG